MTDSDGAREPARPGTDPAELALAHAHADRLAGGRASRGRDDGPDAARVLDALDAARADLARHGQDLVRETPAMPPALLAGLDRTLAAERARSTTGAGDADHARRWPRRALPALAAAAAVLLVLVVVVTGLVARGGSTGAPAAPVPRAGGEPTVVDPPRAGGPRPGPSPVVPVLGTADVADVAVALRTGLGRSDYGPLGDPVRRAACLGAVGLAPGVTPAGAREVVFEGRPAILLVLTTGVAARFRIVVVDAACGPGRPLVLAERFVGR